MESSSRSQSAVPGATARRPTDIPRRGWLAIVTRGWRESKDDQVPLLAAGVAFYGFVAIFPAVIALVSLYGFFANPTTIASQVRSASQGLPGQGSDLIVNQIKAITARGRSTLGIGAIVSIVIALWSASSGMNKLLTAINAAYDEKQTRTFVKQRLLALALTAGAIVFMVIMLILVAVVSPVLQSVVANEAVRWLLEIARFIVIAALLSGALAVLYRIGPQRDAPKFRWVSAGAIIATVLWLAASVGFAIYTSTFGNYAKTYGAFAGIIVLLMWLWLTSYAILLGAEINAESEQQTFADTTEGLPEPMGRRDAVKADTPPPQEGAG